VGVGDYRSLWHPANDGTTILDIVDFVAFHSYDAFAVRGQIEEIERRTNKPVLLEEMGWPTSPGEYPQPSHSTYDESTQNLLYRTMLAAARETDIAGVMQWTLYDYTPRSSTHNERPSSFEEHFGLVRTDGSFKPAAAIFKDDYTGRILPSDTRTYRPLTPAGKRNK
jgi:endo-1,4-beta-mannosidase